ncbi:hypothetical protein IMY05_012G0043500 [Salix suchowensis]|nr:hypothetical protein IMY05_012G0043500 [Salix suchowensis]
MDMPIREDVPRFDDQGGCAKIRRASVSKERDRFYREPYCPLDMSIREDVPRFDDQVFPKSAIDFTENILPLDMPIREDVPRFDDQGGCAKIRRSSVSKERDRFYREPYCPLDMQLGGCAKIDDQVFPKSAIDLQRTILPMDMQLGGCAKIRHQVFQRAHRFYREPYCPLDIQLGRMCQDSTTSVSKSAIDLREPYCRWICN